MYTEQLTQELSIAATPIQPQTLNNSSASTGNSGIDMQKFRRALFVILTGTVTAGGSLSAKLQESADGSTGWTAIDSATFALVIADNNVQVIQFTRTARYVRYAATLTGSSPSVKLAVLIGGQQKTM